MLRFCMLSLLLQDGGGANVIGLYSTRTSGTCLHKFGFLLAGSNLHCRLSSVEWRLLGCSSASKPAMQRVSSQSSNGYVV